MTGLSLVDAGALFAPFCALGDVMVRSGALVAALLLMPCAANAAELPVPKLHKAHRAAVHRAHHVRTAYQAKLHFGYYFGHWGSRWGGTAGSWYGSTFVLAGAPGWDEALALKANPKGIAAIHCPDWRPLACLAEPVVTPVAAAGWSRR
jgi:hypothetical protein